MMTEIVPYKGGFFAVVSQTQFLDILGTRARRARNAWYHQRHVERWERRYSKPYPEPKITVGTWTGMTIHYAP